GIRGLRRVAWSRTQALETPRRAATSDRDNKRPLTRFPPISAVAITIPLFIIPPISIARLVLAFHGSRIKAQLVRAKHDRNRTPNTVSVLADDNGVLTRRPSVRPGWHMQQQHNVRVCLDVTRFLQIDHRGSIVYILWPTQLREQHN